MAAAVMLAAAPVPAEVQSAPSPASAATTAATPATAGPTPAAASGSLQLKVRRLPDTLELVLEGVGSAPQLQQSLQGGQWQAQLSTLRPLALRQGPVRLALPELGVEAVTLTGAGQSFQLQVQPLKGFPVLRPVVSADGRDLILSFPAAPQASFQAGRFDLNRPTRLPQPAPAPPLQPRAVAPPLGDMAVGSMMLRNRGYVPLSGPPVTLTARAASARDLLFSLAQIGGYGFAYRESASTGMSLAAGGGSAGQSSAVCGQTPAMVQGGSGSSSPTVFVPCPVTVHFRNEPYDRAFNFVLTMAGLQAQRMGNTIMVGPNALSQSIGTQLSKVYRLNQVSANGASQYLASLGAVINVPNVTTQTSSSGSSTNTGAGAAAGGSTASNTSTSTSTSTFIQSYGSATGPLQGLTGTIDGRLSTITLVGDPAVVAIAEQYLRQLDLRQRQVALTVRILDVTLNNDTSIENSFAFRYGNNFIVNNRGELQGAFGALLPPRGGQFEGMSGGASSTKPVVVELADGTTSVVQQPLSPAPVNPGLAYQPGQFYDFVNAQIQSRNTKVLASPTLILSENPDKIEGGAAVVKSDNALGGFASIGRPFANESFVTVGTQVITDYAVSAGQNGAANTCQPKFQTAGLTFGAKVSKIDDNGFVTFTLSPSVSAITGSQSVAGCGPINLLSVRRLDTGSVRVRDGQTLILTGVISDTDSQAVTKWPILGDLPLIGQFFRGSSGTRQKNELVLLVTPRIIQDEQGGTYGYGYQPAGQDARLMMSAPTGSP